MPVITTPPITISGNPPNTDLGNVGQQNHLGPFVFGTDQYLVLLTDPATQTISIYKSTDGGATWALKDALNAPDTIQEDLFATADSGTLIEIVCTMTSAGDKIAYVAFDPATDTYAAPVLATGGATNFRACRFAAGNFLVLYQDTAAHGFDYVRFAAGAWSAPASAFTDATKFVRIRGLVGDATGVGHFNYRQNLNGNLGAPTLFYRQFSSLNVASAATALSVGASSGDAYNNGPMEIWNSRIIIPGTDVTTARPIFYEGTPVAAPVWTTNEIDTAVGLFVIGLQLSGASILFWWASDGQTHWNYASYDGVTVSAPTFYYDATNNLAPPGGFDPADAFISAPTVGLLTGGGLGVAMRLLYNPAEDRSMFLIGAGEPPPVDLPISCNNPPVGIVATFYFHTFPVDGTPPYSFEITGGALPDGLTLDPVTGDVSGTPTVNGLFPFTIQVTDADDAVGSVDCSITIRKRCMLVDVE